MKREIHKWNSSSLQKEMEIAVYGFYGYALLMFPNDNADYMEYENSHVIEAISPYIEQGHIKVYSINSVNSESLMNDSIDPSERSQLHGQYNQYIINEVLPFIYETCNGEVPVVAAGVSAGAYHAVNSFFRRPDIFNGLIALSGMYDIRYFMKDHFDDHCYFNSPADFLPNLADEILLDEMRSGKIIIASGQGENEIPSQSNQLSEILNSKNIPHLFDLWGHDMSHDWPTWRQMLPYFLAKIDPSELVSKAKEELQDLV
jgi:esterase/lipase superfamily enzyme